MHTCGLRFYRSWFHYRLRIGSVGSCLPRHVHLWFVDFTFQFFSHLPRFFIFWRCYYRGRTLPRSFGFTTPSHGCTQHLPTRTCRVVTPPPPFTTCLPTIPALLFPFPSLFGSVTCTYTRFVYAVPPFPTYYFYYSWLRYLYYHTHTCHLPLNVSHTYGSHAFSSHSSGSFVPRSCGYGLVTTTTTHTAATKTFTTTFFTHFAAVLWICGSFHFRGCFCGSPAFARYSFIFYHLYLPPRLPHALHATVYWFIPRSLPLRLPVTVIYFTASSPRSVIYCLLLPRLYARAHWFCLLFYHSVAHHSVYLPPPTHCLPTLPPHNLPSPVHYLLCTPITILLQFSSSYHHYAYVHRSHFMQFHWMTTTRRSFSTPATYPPYIPYMVRSAVHYLWF